MRRSLRFSPFLYLILICFFLCSSVSAQVCKDPDVTGEGDGAAIEFYPKEDADEVEDCLPSPEVFVQQGEEAYRQQDYNTAISFYQKAVKCDPDNVKARDSLISLGTDPDSSGGSSKHEEAGTMITSLEALAKERACTAAKKDAREKLKKAKCATGCKTFATVPFECVAWPAEVVNICEEEAVADACSVAKSGNSNINCDAKSHCALLAKVDQALKDYKRICVPDSQTCIQDPSTGKCMMAIDRATLERIIQNSGGELAEEPAMLDDPAIPEELSHMPDEMNPEPVEPQASKNNNKKKKNGKFKNRRKKK